MIRMGRQRRTRAVDRKRGLTTITLAVGALLALAACSSGGDNQSSEPSPLASVAPAAPSPAPFMTPTTPASAPAASPADAVTAYLNAEVARDYAASFGLLAGADRQQVVSPAAWRATKSRAPRLTGFTVATPTTSGDARSTVITDVTLEPAVDPILGVVPAKARITWTPVAEDGGWRVSLQGSTFEPQYPSDAGAAPAALSWVQSRQACAPEAAADRLVYEPDLPGALCGVSGTFQAGAAMPITSFANPAPVFDSYGPDAAAWARVVHVTGPTTIDVVTAPLGDDWVVIGARSG
jgi:hypothetical protein